MCIRDRHGSVRLHTVEQFEDDSGDAAKMAGTKFAFEQILDFWRIDRVLLWLGVEIILSWRKQDIDAGGNQLVAIRLEGARVFVEIVGGGKLQAIDKNAGNHRVAVGAGLALSLIHI